MSTITTKDGTQIFYKDWGTGQPVVFSHGWPLSGDAWEVQMMFLAHHGYRTIAHDRRGHGRSSQPWNGNDMDTYADDLAELIDTLELTDAILVGHSTGGGEVTHYLGRHGTARVRKAVLVGAVPPLMLKTASNPGGLPIEVFDAIRAGTLADRSQFFRDLAAGPFYGFNRPDAKRSQGLIDSFWLQGVAGSLKGQYDCIRQFSEIDLHGRSEQDRHPDAGDPRRRRSDRADRCVGKAVVETAAERRPENLSGRAAWPGQHACRSAQRRPAHLHHAMTRRGGRQRRPPLARSHRPPVLKPAAPVVHP